MLRIGDFLLISRVPVKTLRYYDEIGLFRPARVDRFTGYRLYSAAQLPALNRILALKDLGFSLEQIARLHTATIPAAIICEMLAAKRDELAARVQEEGERLGRVEARLRQIEGEDFMPTYDVIVKQVEPGQIAAIREVVPTVDDMATFYRGSLDAILAAIQRHGWKKTGPWMALKYNDGYTEQDIDIELAIPVALTSGSEQTPDAAEDVVLRALPGTTVASTVHHGPYDRLGDGYTPLIAWIHTNGYHIAGPSHEIYLTSPDAPGEPITEIQFPVEK